MPISRNQNSEFFDLISKYINSNISNTIYEKNFFCPLCKLVRNVTILKYIAIDHENNFFDGKILTILEAEYLQISGHLGPSVSTNPEPSPDFAEYISMPMNDPAKSTCQNQ
jgi:hypothetical protein